MKSKRRNKNTIFYLTNEHTKCSLYFLICINLYIMYHVIRFNNKIICIIYIMLTIYIKYKNVLRCTIIFISL